MSISRSFLLMGGVYLLIGMILGSYMAGAHDYTLVPVHAHLNLLGFTLMTVFALVYKIFDGMAENKLARLHFWMHQAGVLAMMAGLFLMLAKILPEETVGPVMPITDITVVLATAIFVLNAMKNAH